MFLSLVSFYVAVPPSIQIRPLQPADDTLPDFLYLRRNSAMLWAENKTRPPGII